jgi:hypothetical protein
LRERGHAAGICRDQPPIITVPRSPSKLTPIGWRMAGASSGHPSTRHRYASREVVLGPVDEGHNRSSKRLLILTLVLLQEAQANECVDVRFIQHDWTFLHGLFCRAGWFATAPENLCGSRPPGEAVCQCSALILLACGTPPQDRTGLGVERGEPAKRWLAERRMRRSHPPCGPF